MTTRLYYSDAARLDFDATVIDVDPGGQRVYLDRTAFYPTSGGQPHDTGLLGGTPVVDVVDEGERIAHVLQAPHTLAVGATVHGTVDAARRRDHMQQHTGQHLLSAVFADLYGAGTASVHFGAEISLVELDVASLTREQLVAAEIRANAIVREARPVTVAFEEAATAAGLRKPSTRDGVLRIVTIAALDRSACGGTHVATTAEVGPILLRRMERIRQRLRVEFLCGGRAVGRARADFEALTAIAEALSAAPADVPGLVAAQGDRIRALEQERRALLQGLGGERARFLRAASPEANGRRVVIERLDGVMSELHRATAQAAAELPASVYVAADASLGTIVLAASADTGLHAGNLLRDVVQASGGRGGGSPRVAQGSVRVEAVHEVVAVLAQSVRG